MIIHDNERDFIHINPSKEEKLQPQFWLSALLSPYTIGNASPNGQETYAARARLNEGEHSVGATRQTECSPERNSERKDKLRQYKDKNKIK
jgi:hypothetical protein